MVFGRDDKAEDAEERLRARLADLEGRLDDAQKLRQLESHIQNLNEKHKVELEKARLDAKAEIDRVKGKATAMVKKAKKRIRQHEARYDRVVDAIAELAQAVEKAHAKGETLKGKGLKLSMVPDQPRDDPREDPRAFLHRLARQAEDVADRLTRLEEAIGDGQLATPATDLDLLEDRSKELLSNPELKSKALTVAEKARMFAQDPGKSQYYQELLRPYAEAIQQVLEEDTHASIVYGCQEALNVLEEAFRDSRTFLLRRSGHLDDHTIEATVTVERLEQPAEDAVGRMRTVIDTARALGPVDFFHNMEQELSRRVERGQQGARAAAWVLSDVTVAVLEDEVVRGWLEAQT